MIVKGGVPIRRIPKASSVSIQAGQRVFHKRADGSYDPASITLRAEIKNVNNPKYTWGRIVNGIFQSNGVIYNTLVVNPAYTGVIAVRVRGDNIPNYIEEYTSISVIDDGQPGVTYSIEVMRGSTHLTALSCNADGSLKGINEFEGKFYKTTGNKKETCGLKFIIYGYKSDGSLGIVFHCSTTVGGFGNMYFVDKNWNEYEGILVSCYEGNDRKNIICELMLPKIIDGQSGEAGQKGLPGCAIRRSEWKAGIEYRNDEAINAATRYLDIAMVRAKNSIGWRGYKCLQTHVSAESNKPGNATYWEELPTNTVGILASLIIARDAKLDFLSGNEIRILDANDRVTAGVSGSGSGETGIRFYAGSDDPKNAPFRVDEKGKVIAGNGEFHGTVYATDGEFTGKVATSLDGKRIVINPEDNSLRMYGSNNRLMLNICYYEGSAFGDNDNCAQIYMYRYRGENRLSDMVLQADNINMVQRGFEKERSINISPSGIEVMEGGKTIAQL